ncbi:MAG: TetR/AcrR family transcriptional regulator [Alphaproteobacteria bacterium]|nr:MAG: TetR/AcrR family transcriptional regulator [Alphaproteobacteria bacterium]
MPRTNPEARDRLIATAADMLQRRGMNATSVRDLAKEAKAPLGSTYHYFPGGKQQVVEEAVQYAGNLVASRLAIELRAGPAEGLRAFLDLWRTTVLRSEFRAGCPVLAVSAEEPASEDAMSTLSVAAAVFSEWERLLAASLVEHGVPPETAHEVATLIVASVEGSVVLCRAKRSIEPLDRIGRQLEAVIRGAINQA